MERFFLTFQAKDWLTLFASVSALFFSSITLWQKKTESRIALKKQLTDLLEKLSDLNKEISKFRFSQKKDEYPPNYIGLMNDQRRLLVWQADTLISKIKKQVNSYEFLIVAGSFDGIDQSRLAEKYFQLAMRAEDLNLKGIATRGYARFLFNEGDHEEARKRYFECLNYFKGNDDRLILYRYDTFLRWANQENEWGNKEKEIALLEKAKKEIVEIKNPAKKEQEMKKIDSLVKKPFNSPNSA